jgi:hypothetical protein
MARLLEGVDGWLHPAEAAVLYHAACQAHTRAPACVVEIGSWQGRSTIALATAAKEAGGDRVVAIDPHISTASFDGDANLAALERNLVARDLRSFVDIVREPSGEAAERFEDGSIDVLFIDGDHSYEGASIDIEAYAPKLRPGAVVGFNDPHLEGVHRALKALVLVEGSAFAEPRWVVNSLFFRFGCRSISPAERRRALAFLHAGGLYHRSTERLVSRFGSNARVRAGMNLFSTKVARHALRAVLPEAS